MPEIPQDRLCLACEKREIIGKPYSVYVCRECYMERPVWMKRLPDETAQRDGTVCE